MLEKTAIWVEIRNASQVMHKAGVNPIEILRWSEDKKLWEVRLRIEEIKRKKKLKKFGEVWLKEKSVANNKIDKVKTEITTEPDCINDGTTLNKKSLYEIEKELLKKDEYEKQGACNMLFK